MGNAVLRPVRAYTILPGNIQQYAYNKTNQTTFEAVRECSSNPLLDSPKGWILIKGAVGEENEGENLDCFPINRGQYEASTNP